MSIRVGINGFGRMGRLALRAAWNWPELEIVHINEVQGGAQCAAHLLEFDSVHGRWAQEVDHAADHLGIEGKRIGFSEHKAPGQVPWQELGVDVVVEASGKFRTPELLQPYFDRGVKKVIVAAPVKEGALNLVMGVNDHLYDPAEHHLLTAASCTTNCLAPVVKVLHEQIGIEHGVITTIHDATNTQVVVDAPHQDLRRARAAGMSLIPTTTGSATAITLIYPELKGKLNGHAIRVPLLTGSLTDAVFEMSREVTAAEVNRLFHRAADTYLKGILGIEERPLVSIDFKSDPRSAIVDGPSTMAVDGNQLKVFIWYDNEMGYANRLMELCKKVVQSL